MSISFCYLKELMFKCTYTNEIPPNIAIKKQVPIIKLVIIIPLNTFVSTVKPPIPSVNYCKQTSYYIVIYDVTQLVFIRKCDSIEPMLIISGWF